MGASVSRLGGSVSREVRQVASKDMTDQSELALAREPVRADVSVEMIRRQRTASAAFSLACSASGLEDKEIYLALGIDPGHFSRIKKGEAGFHPDRMREFCALVGNRIYPEWIAYQVGTTLVMIQSEAERLLDAERARATALAAENRLMRELLGR